MVCNKVVIPVCCQIEQEVTEAMLKSLNYCDLQTKSARQPLYQYRAASMYHSCFRNQVRTRPRTYTATRVKCLLCLKTFKGCVVCRRALRFSVCYCYVSSSVPGGG